MEYLSVLFSIIIVNLLLSGDNALVIALASRQLSLPQRKKAILWGGAGAIVLRIMLTLVAVVLLQVPYLQLAGGLLLLWVAIKLAADDHDATKEVRASDNLWEAVRTILVADLVMSLDNVVAIAAVARGNVVMLILGLAISIPIIIWGSKLIMLLIERWPVIIIAGAAFLGWTAGDMLLADPKILPYANIYPYAHWVIPGICAAAAVLAGILKDNRGVRERD